MSRNTRELNFLVVDDSTSMRRIIKRTLAEMGCAGVFEAASVREALEIILAEQVDFIVCDWNMPGMKGIDFLTHIRESEQLNDIPFLMVSAESRMENLLEAIRNGVSNYLTKPFTPALLKRKIEAILAIRRQSAFHAQGGPRAL